MPALPEQGTAAAAANFANQLQQRTFGRGPVRNINPGNPNALGNRPARQLYQAHVGANDYRARPQAYDAALGGKQMNVDIAKQAGRQLMKNNPTVNSRGVASPGNRFAPGAYAKTGYISDIPVMPQGNNLARLAGPIGKLPALGAMPMPSTIGGVVSDSQQNLPVMQRIQNFLLRSAGFDPNQRSDMI